MLCASPDLAWHAIAKAPLDGKPLSAALAFVKMIVPLVPLAFVLFPRMSLVGCVVRPGRIEADLWPGRPLWCLHQLVRQVPARQRFVATVVHAHGIRAVVMVLRRPISRLDFASEELSFNRVIRLAERVEGSDADIVVLDTGIERSNDLVRRGLCDHAAGHRRSRPETTLQVQAGRSPTIVLP